MSMHDVEGGYRCFSLSLCSYEPDNEDDSFAYAPKSVEVFGFAHRHVDTAYLGRSTLSWWGLMQLPYSDLAVAFGYSGRRIFSIRDTVGSPDVMIATGSNAM